MAHYGEKLYYYNKNVEVDFLVAEEGYAVQVSYSVYGEGMQDTFERETKALKLLDAFLSLKRMVIVTYDEEGTFSLEDSVRRMKAKGYAIEDTIEITGLIADEIERL